MIIINSFHHSSDAQVDHSCAPSCTVVFRGQELSVMAERDLGAGEAATISYVNTMLDTTTRQTQLRQHWFFQCQCDLCLDVK